MAVVLRDPFKISYRHAIHHYSITGNNRKFLFAIGSRSINRCCNAGFNQVFA